MIALAWSFFMVLSMVMASSQAFLTAPVSGYAHGLATHSSNLDPTTERTHRLAAAAAAALLPEDDDDNRQSEENEDDDDGDASSSSSEDYAMPASAQHPVGSSGGGVGGSKRRGNDEQTVYVIEFETEADGTGKGEGHRNRAGKDMSDDSSEAQASPLDPWSIVWYIGSFGGLVAFFLIVSCSEWCCRRGARPLSVPYTQRGEVINPNGQPANESPPPPYHLFAPPPYDSVNYAEIADKSVTTGEKLDIYVITVPIHTTATNQQQQQQQQQSQQVLPPPQQPPPA